jgi:hypothetical protein
VARSLLLKLEVFARKQFDFCDIWLYRPARLKAKGCGQPFQPILFGHFEVNRTDEKTLQSWSWKEVEPERVNGGDSMIIQTLKSISLVISSEFIDEIFIHLSATKFKPTRVQVQSRSKHLKLIKSNTFTTKPNCSPNKQQEFPK